MRKVDRFAHFSHNFNLGFRHSRENAAVKADCAAPVFYFRKHFAYGVQQFIERFFLAAPAISLICPLIRYTIFSDLVYRLLSEWCVVTSFYLSSANHVPFYPFSTCATYCTLSLISEHCCPVDGCAP